VKLDMQFDTRGDEGSRELDEEARQKVEAYVAARVGGLRCPDHGALPTIVCSGTRLDNLRFDVKACCQKMILTVKTKLEA